MSAPGQYLPDVTEGVVRFEDLPKAKVIHRSRNFTHQPCPVCGRSCFRNRTGTRILHDVGDLVAGRPRDIHLVYSQHRCIQCHKYFNADMADYALPKAHYTYRVVSLAVRIVVEDGLPRVGKRAEAKECGYEAIRILREAIRNNPSNYKPRVDLASVLCSWPDPGLRDPKAAVGLAQQAVEMAPEHPENWTTLGEAYHRSDQWDAAVTAFHESRRRPGSVRNRNNTLLYLAMAEWRYSSTATVSPGPAPTR